MVEVTDTRVFFTVPARGDQEFDLPLERFNQDSQSLIKREAKDIQPPSPELETKVNIGKRRKKKGSSYYMVNQTIDAKIQVANKDRKRALRDGKFKIVFIGRNRKNSDLYKVLATETFKLSINANDSTELLSDSFMTSYDSDNFGEGNIGGYQYDSHIYFIFNQEGGIIDHGSSDSSFRKKMESSAKVLESASKLSKNTTLNKDLRIKGRSKR